MRKNRNTALARTKAVRVKHNAAVNRPALYTREKESETEVFEKYPDGHIRRYWAEVFDVNQGRFVLCPFEFEPVREVKK